MIFLDCEPKDLLKGVESNQEIHEPTSIHVVIEVIYRGNLQQKCIRVNKLS